MDLISPGRTGRWGGEGLGTVAVVGKWAAFPGGFPYPKWSTHEHHLLAANVTYGLLKVVFT